MRQVWAVLVLLISVSASYAADNDIMFAPKNFTANDEFVGVSGTLSGDDLAYPNNTYAFSCTKQNQQCWVSSIEQIGPKLIGRMDNPYPMDITKWSVNEVVASIDGTCSRTTIVITRNKESLLWVEEPINQAQSYCAKSSKQVRKLTLGDSLGYRKPNAK
jgi:hypothetical protein